MTAQGSPDHCHRCLQPVPATSRRCPHCREIIRRGDTRRLFIYLGVIGIAAILLLVGLSLFLTPPTVDPDNVLEGEQKSAPPKPVKKPPLN